MHPPSAPGGTLSGFHLARIDAEQAGEFDVQTRRFRAPPSPPARSAVSYPSDRHRAASSRAPCPGSMGQQHRAVRNDDDIGGDTDIHRPTYDVAETSSWRVSS